MNTTAPHRRRRLLSLAIISLAATTAGGVAAQATGPTVTAASASAVTATTATTTTADTISATSAAAAAFLATLSEDQQAAVMYDFDDVSKTTSWSNFPVTFVARAGVNLSELTAEQQAAALGVLEALLSDDGYATVSAIIAGDVYLAENSTSTESSLGQYYLAFFGDPAGDTWEVQFGGHHLGINATIDAASSAITFAPTHLGSQPVVYTAADGTEAAPLLAMYETAFAFYDSLSAEQQATLYQGDAVGNLVCAPGDTCSFPTGVGLAGADLTAEQRQLLLDLIANWVGFGDDETTATTLAAIEQTLDETYVNWSGATVFDMSQGDGIYLQISGPDVYIELASQQGSAGADVAGTVTAGWGHLHTIYRDPGNDYANSVVQQAATGMGGGGGGAPGR